MTTAEEALDPWRLATYVPGGTFEYIYCGDSRDENEAARARIRARAIKELRVVVFRKSQFPAVWAAAVADGVIVC